jgi:hypothetical protein
MFSPGISDDFTIMRLRVKGSKLDPLAVRPRVQQLINEIRLHPLLPESASLFIRRFEDPSPGLVRLEAIDSRASRSWRNSFKSRFAELVTSAARPARGPVSSNAESVVFLDCSELLTCLTADWRNGLVGARWWWHSFLRRGDIEQILKRLWLEKIEYAPAALQQLAKTHVLVEFVSALSDRETQDLLERIIERFGLPGLRPVVVSLSQVLGEARSELPFSSPAVTVKEANVRSVTPWQHVVPECDTPRLRPMQQLFLGVALMIRRAPAQVRMQTFARDVEQWRSLVLPELKLEFEERGAVAPIEGPSAIDHEPRVLRIETDRGVVAEEIEVGEFEIEERSFKTPLSSPVVSKPVDDRAGAVRELPAAAEALVFEANAEYDFSPVETGRVVESVLQEFVDVDEPLTIETELGGLFYLVNLGIFLGLYSDFTSPAETLSELNIWDFVALVGSELNEYQNGDDPIWCLLADLACGDRQELFSRKGAKAQSSDLRQTEVFLCAFAPLREKNLIWFSDLMPYLRKRLQRALGVENEELARVLLQHRARVTVTATHLDVFFSLADLPIAIRLSGLDRDPGWTPAAARFIAFHFE